MIRMKRINPEVYFADQSIVSVGPEELNFLQRNVQDTVRQRTRLCAHQSPEESLHEMFVVYTNSTYMRPNKHPKEESLHILGGYADFVFFDLHGNVTDVVQLGPPSSDRPFYCRVPRDTYHTVLIRSDRLVIHEGLTGPFRKDSTTVFAPWAPEEHDAAGVEAFSERLDAEVTRRVAGKPRASLRLVRRSPEVFQSNEPVGRFGRSEMEFLSNTLAQSPRRRVRICMHQSAEDPFQEMFIMFAKGSYLAASKHLGKDESVDVIEGKADFVLFDDAGNITNVIAVGDQSTGLPFYLRTPHERYHAWIVRSDVFAVHETTEGPFRPEDTVLAPWSPADVHDPIAVPQYQTLLDNQAARFIGQPAEAAP